MNEQEALFNIGTPSLKNLSHILRHKELWPEGFRWNYRQCTTCAMGIAHELWIQKFNEKPYSTPMAFYNMTCKFKIPHPCAASIFLDAHMANNVSNRSKVTPEMVADQIDAYLFCKETE